MTVKELVEMITKECENGTMDWEAKMCLMSRDGSAFGVTNAKNDDGELVLSE